MHNRSRLIDVIDEVGNYRYRSDYGLGYETVYEVIKDITGLDPETLDDSDRNEGYFSNFQTGQLEGIYNVLRKKVLNKLNNKSFKSLMYMHDLEDVMDLFDIEINFE